ncbi:homeobox-DDT domain protein RLT2-like isoform X2 [Gastrolobium bilobum]|uniref:homeobox-DDT domain protein RLT2-like isoform X2 n=1 Tax=Gastrolobium bilobum TaxID=150636 RepID=UPI002AAF7B7E|nr:homeobox-DDT domain protein RLT2-like isoform X2 [Gastrolobium bilobum]
MESGSEGEKNKKPPEGENKTKRKMKTASQLEVLEKTYAEEAYPSEALRAELSVKLGLSDRQLQMWFCHRRLKDRKAAPAAKKLRNEVGEGVEQIAVADARHDPSLVSGLKQFGHLDSRRVVSQPGMMAFPRMGAGLPAMESNSYYEAHQTIEELRAIAFVERQLGEPLREDGPILGMKFDSLPPGAFGTPIGTVTLGQHRQSARPFEGKIYEQLDKNEEARMQREIEAQEKRIRKELEKQDILRQKREEQIKKEMERNDRERRKEEERLVRERQREEERYQREQRRELERREKFLQKESIRAEKLRQKEELRREKEVARIKAANERAIARRMVKESMELIEDECLELMELAASKKGLSSILALDYETMQNLELYRDGQTSFPPKSVQLKRAFSIQPWSKSDENIGNLLMVWRFLITFADVLGVWPFTLDEFIQAFHDYDSRLLGEIHIALLRSLIKDIEDVARTASTGLGANQNNVANSGGGHPQVVEGAYVWGFDIRNWQRHLNPLTWPEILRQFALSAGFGPQMKKQNIDQVHPCNNNEGNDGRDIISRLRSGAAAKNAVAIMQEKGLSNPRRSRHRLTPGTVKFAAFHVLSVEGSNGLNILEVANKIQKSGLRDLTTSKTPEASIAAALSRDTKLFERTAPSTYCVRPAYRKDAADSDAIFSTARERIRLFRSGFMDVEVDDGEKDDDSESDVAEDPEINDLGTEIHLKKKASNSEEFNANTVMSGKDSEILQKVAEDFNEHKDVSASSEIAVCSNDVNNSNLEGMKVDEGILGEPWVHGLAEGEYSDLSVEERLHALVALIGVAIEGNSIRVVLEERLEAANALKKQMWAEAQLDKRRIKEEYFFKMQSVSNMGNKNEAAVAIPTVEGKQSPLLAVDDKNDEALFTPCGQHEQTNVLQENQNHLRSFPLEVNMQMQDCSMGPDNYFFQQSGFAAEKSRPNLKSYIGHLAEQTYMYRSLPLGLDRRHNRYWRFIASASHNDPGCGRIFVELHDGCWRLIDSEEGFDALLASLDVRGIRESHLHMMLQRIEMSFRKSVRRNVLNGNMRMQNGDAVNGLKTEVVEMVKNQDCNANSNIHCPTSVCIDNSDATVTSTSFVVQLGRNEAENKDIFMRYQDFEEWMRKECLNSSILCAMKFEKKRCSQLLVICDLCHHVYFSGGIQCPSCHRTFSTFKSNSSSSEHVTHSKGKMKIGIDYFNVSSSSPLRMRLLKIFLAVVEVTLPQEALQPLWTDGYRKSWSAKLDASSSTEDILQILTALEGAIKREYLASNYETTHELLGSFSSSGCPINNDSIGGESIPVLPWVPYTTAAVALRLMELDACTFYTSQQKLESEKDKRIGIVMKLPSKYAAAKNSYNADTIETSHQAEHTVENWVNLGAGLTSYSRGQRTRQGHSHSQSGRSQGRVVRSRYNSRKRSTASSSRKMGKLLGWKGRSCGKGGPVRGRRSIRSGQKPAAAKVDVISGERDTPKDITEETSKGIFVREEIDEGEMEDTALNASSSGRSGYEDDIYQATGDEYDYLVDNNDRYLGGFSGKSENFVKESHYNVDDEEGVGIDDEDDDDGRVDVDVEDYIIGDSDTRDSREENPEQNMDPDGIGSTSSDYSD